MLDGTRDGMVSVAEWKVAISGASLSSAAKRTRGFKFVSAAEYFVGVWHSVGHPRRFEELPFAGDDTGGGLGDVGLGRFGRAGRTRPVDGTSKISARRARTLRTVDAHVV